MNEYLSLRHLHLDVLENDPALCQMIDGLFANAFALFLVKIVPPLGDGEWKTLIRAEEALVAGYIQNNHRLLHELGDPEIIWDIYLVFLTKGELTVEQKVEIENDRFFCKKVVYPYQAQWTLEEHLHQLTLFQQFSHASRRDGAYLGKDAFVRELLNGTGNPQLAAFVREHDFIASDEEELLAGFRNHFGLDGGE